MLEFSIPVFFNFYSFDYAGLFDNGRGFYLDIGLGRYVSPVARVRAVMVGKNRKGPVSRVVNAS